MSVCFHYMSSIMFDHIDPLVDGIFAYRFAVEFIPIGPCSLPSGGR